MDAKKLAILFLLFAPIASAQKTTGPQPEVLTSNPAISTENHAKIRDLQRKQDALILASMRLQIQQNDIEKKFAALNLELEQAMSKALIEAKADGKDWTVDPDTLDVKPFPKPPTPPPAATPPPPAEKKKP